MNTIKLFQKAEYNKTEYLYQLSQIYTYNIKPFHVQQVLLKFTSLITRNVDQHVAH